MPAGADRRRRQRAQGAAGGRGRLSRERPELARAAAPLRDENGLVLDPELATGDGALGFWQALREVWPKTKQQRCWVHKTANVLNKLPASLQGQGQAGPTRDLRGREPKAGRAGARPLCREIRRQVRQGRHLLEQGPREPARLLRLSRRARWKHVRTSNPIESTFATVRLRTDKTKGCLSRPTALAMVFKLAKSAERHWRRLDGSERLAQVIEDGWYEWRRCCQPFSPRGGGHPAGSDTNRLDIACPRTEESRFACRALRETAGPWTSAASTPSSSPSSRCSC